MGQIARGPVAIDTNIFIYLFQNHQEFGQKSIDLFAQLITNRTPIITSVITLTELLSLPASTPQVLRLKTTFLELPNLNLTDVNQSIATKAAQIRRKFGFRLPDAIQLATAIYTKARRFVTNDTQLSKFPSLPITILSNAN